MHSTEPLVKFVPLNKKNVMNNTGISITCNGLPWGAPHLIETVSEEFFIYLTILLYYSKKTVRTSYSFGVAFLHKVI